jgi:hypothetical protein
MAKNNTVDARRPKAGRIPWGLEDRIRWVEWRIRELTISKGKYTDERGRWLLEGKAAGGRKFEPGDAVSDYAVWLLHLRDGLSWHQLACRFFPFATEESVEKFELRVRRMFDRVERHHPGSEEFKPQPLSRQDKLLLRSVAYGVVPVYLSAPDNFDL